MPGVAVIIPVFNRQELLVRAIASVRRQTMGDFECIVVDDSSDVPVTLPDVDRRFSLIRFERRRGVSAARNRGVAASSASLIAFLDSDDEWLPHKLERQCTFIDVNPQYDILQSREVWIRRGIRVNPPMTHKKHAGDLFAESLKRCMITPSSVMLRRTLFESVGGFNESIPACEDYDLWLRITARRHVGLVDEHLLVRYGGHDDQLSAEFTAPDRFRVRSMLQLIQYQHLDEYRQELVRQQIGTKAAILAHGYRKRGNHAAARQYFALAGHYGNS